MASTHFNYSFGTNKTIDEVYNRLLDPKQWWIGLFDEIITGQSEKPGDEFNFKAGGGLHETRQKLIDLVPNQRIVWQVTKSHLTFLSDPEEWKGSNIRFDLQKKDGGTEIRFTHEGLVPEIECYESCSSAWTSYMEQLRKALS